MARFTKICRINFDTSYFLFIFLYILIETCKVSDQHHQHKPYSHASFSFQGSTIRYHDPFRHY